MRLFASSLVEDAKVWIDRCPKGSIKSPKELQRAFRIRWCDSEHSQDSFSQYLSICKGSCESVRDFSDRFNLLLKRVRSKVGSEQAILDHFLSSLEGTLQFTLKDRSPATLEEAQDLAFQIEKNLEFEDYIHQRDLSQNVDLWDPGNKPVMEPEPPRILQVELAPTKRKWSLSHESITPSQEPPLEKFLLRTRLKLSYLKTLSRILQKIFLFLFTKWDTLSPKLVSSHLSMSLSESKTPSSATVSCTQVPQPT